MKAPVECAICDAEAKHIDVRVSTDGGPEDRFLCCDGACCTAGRGPWAKESLPLDWRGYPGPPPLDTENLDVPALIAAECDAVRDLLLTKNAKYGNSALEPARIFSKANPVEQILVRIDDKLSRIRTTGAGAQPDEDTVQDLIGYLILLRVAQRKAKT